MLYKIEVYTYGYKWNWKVTVPGTTLEWRGLSQFRRLAIVQAHLQVWTHSRERKRMARPPYTKEIER